MKELVDLTIATSDLRVLIVLALIGAATIEGLICYGIYKIMIHIKDSKIRKDVLKRLETK